MLGKLGDLLNKDVGSLVKDAGKVLNTDVGTLAKGAGKVLNADLGELMRRDNGESGEGAVADPAPVEAVAAPPVVTAPGRTPPPSRAPQPPAPVNTPAPMPAYDADATLKLNPGNDATVVMAPVGDPSSVPSLDDDLLTRSSRPMPKGTSLLELLPHAVGEFERPKAAPAGELTSDPVTAIYSSGGHPIAVKLISCWDEDEAADRLKDVKTQSGKSFRAAPDGSWVLGDTLQGLMFAWTRGNYAFSATAPKGEVSMVRFLRAFPY